MNDDIRHTIQNALLSMKNIYRIKSMTKPEEAGYWEGHLEEVFAALAWLEEQPEAPEPDWNDAPEWAEWAVAYYRMMFKGPVGGVWMFTDVEPTEQNEFGWIVTGRRGDGLHGGVFDLPIGVDPRTLKQRRPETT